MGNNLGVKLLKARAAWEEESDQIKQIEAKRESRGNDLVAAMEKRVPAVLKDQLALDVILERLMDPHGCAFHVPYGECKGMETSPKIRAAFKKFQERIGPHLKIQFRSVSGGIEVTMHLLE